MSAGGKNDGGWKKLVGSKLLKIGVGYPLVAWFVIQIAEVILPALRLPEWTVTLVIALVILGYPIALILGWASSSERKTTEKVAVDERSIAVLPFLDMSQDADQAYFCEGMAEEIINDLVKVGRLKVASRTSSFSFRDSDQDAIQIGRDLNVASILEGSVKKAGNRLRINAQLVNVKDGYQLWSERFDREFNDVFEIQDEIARSIVRTLEIQLTPQEAAAMSLPISCSPAAYKSYLKGRHEFNKFGRRGLEAAVTWFEKVLEECDTFAPAHAGLADALSHIYMFQDARDEIRQRAIKNAERALELDPDSAETHTSLGLARMLVDDLEGSERSFRKALELNPNASEAHHMYARMLWSGGRHEEAKTQFKLATELNPDDYQSPNLLVSLMRDNVDDQAIRYAEISVQRSLAQLEREPDDVRAMYLMAGSMILLGRNDEAIEWAERAITMQPASDSYYNVACVFVMLDDHDRALEMLEQANLRGRNYAWMINDPDLAPLRGHPRFEAILEKVR